MHSELRHNELECYSYQIYRKRQASSNPTKSSRSVYFLSIYVSNRIIAVPAKSPTVYNTPRTQFASRETFACRNNHSPIRFDAFRLMPYIKNCGCNLHTHTVTIRQPTRNTNKAKVGIGECAGKTLNSTRFHHIANHRQRRTTAVLVPAALLRL